MNLVYDEGNETHADPFSAKKCARVLNELGTRNPVRILRGGYIEFSRKYPFLRVGGKICYSARQLESFFKVGNHIIVKILLSIRLQIMHNLYTQNSDNATGVRWTSIH